MGASRGRRHADVAFLWVGDGTPLLGVRIKATSRQVRQVLGNAAFMSGNLSVSCQDREPIFMLSRTRPLRKCFGNGAGMHDRVDGHALRTGCRTPRQSFLILP